MYVSRLVRITVDSYILKQSENIEAKRLVIFAFSKEASKYNCNYEQVNLVIQGSLPVETRGTQHYISGEWPSSKRKQINSRPQAQQQSTATSFCVDLAKLAICRACRCSILLYMLAIFLGFDYNEIPHKRSKQKPMQQLHSQKQHFISLNLNPNIHWTLTFPTPKKQKNYKNTKK